jgi:hypothetical protein
LKLQFKFREDSARAARRELIDKLSTKGASGVHRLFPRERDSELSSLYVVDVREQKTVRRLLRLLQQSELVEFAENEARRRLLS